MIKQYKKFLMVLIVFFLMGCGSVATKAVGVKKYTPREPNHPIDVFCMKPLHSTEYDSLQNIQYIFGQAFERRNEIPDNIAAGRVEVKGAPGWSWQRLIMEAKQKARELGGDAIVITRYDYRKTASEYVEGTTQQAYGRILFAVVIRYTKN